MNKNIKIIIWITVGVCFCAGGWFLYLIYGPKKSIESLLPADAVVFASLKHPAKYWQMGVQSEFWNNIAAIDVPQLFEHNKITPVKIDQIEKLKKNVAIFFKSPITQKFLEKEIAVAVYRHPNISAAKNLDEAYGALLALRLPASMQALAFTSQMFSDWSKEIHMTQEMYKGKCIVHVYSREKNFRFKYVLIDDILIASSESETYLNQVIDAALHQRKSLKDDEHYQFAQSHAYANAESIAFVDVESFIRAFIVFSFQPGNVNKYKFALGYKSQLLSHAFAKMASCRPQENNSLALIPSSAISYQWSTCYDFGDLWGQVKEKADVVSLAQVKALDFKRGIEKRLGLNFSSDLTSVLGKEAGGYLTDIDTLGVFPYPYPRFLLFVTIKDRAKVQELLTKLLGGYAGLIKDEQYHGEDIHYFSLPLGANMDPGYSFMGDYLLLSSSRQLIKKSIDTFHEPETSLRKVKNFESLNWSFKDHPYSITYVKVGEFSKRLRDILTWVDRHLTSQTVSTLTFEQEGNQKKLDLASDIMSKEDELKQSDIKLKELRLKDLSELTADEQSMQEANIKNIELDQLSLKQDISDGNNQIQNIDKQLKNVHVQAQNIKVIMYNSQHVVVPLLKGLESFKALGISVSIKNQVFETEFMVN